MKEVKEKEFTLTQVGARIKISETDKNSTELPKLKAAIYEVVIDEEETMGYYLKEIDKEYPQPKKLFGTTTQRRTKRLLGTYKKSDYSVGVMGIGDKGSGKTEQLKHSANHFMKEFGLPVIEIRKFLPKNKVELIVNGVGPCFVLMDEYGKDDMYSMSSKEGDRSDELLTTFSNRALPKVIWAITENRYGSLSPYIRDRYGRFKFRYFYRGTPEDVVRDIAKYYKLKKEFEDFLVDHSQETKESIDNIIGLAETATECKTMTEFQEEFQDLNVRPPRFIKYSIGTTDVSKLSAKVTGNNIAFTVKGESGEQVVTYELESLKSYRNQRGTIDGVPYKVEQDKMDEKPPSEYDCTIKVLPEKEFTSGWFL